MNKNRVVFIATEKPVFGHKPPTNTHCAQCGRRFKGHDESRPDGVTGLFVCKARQSCEREAARRNNQMGGLFNGV